MYEKVKEKIRLPGIFRKKRQRFFLRFAVKVTKKY